MFTETRLTEHYNDGLSVGYNDAESSDQLCQYWSLIIARLIRFTSLVDSALGYAFSTKHERWRPFIISVANCDFLDFISRSQLLVYGVKLGNWFRWCLQFFA